MSPPPVPAGLQVLGSDVDANRVPSGLVVEEDHGQVVSRDEVYAALGLGASSDANLQVGDIAPIFEESGVRIEEERATSGAEKDGPGTKRPRVEERKDERDAVAAVEPRRAIATTATAVTTSKPGTDPHPPVPPAQPNVQFIRVGSTNPPAVVKPLITRLEEEKKRKRKKKKNKAVQGDDQGKEKPSPWDDLFSDKN